MNVITILKRAVARALSLVGVFMLVVAACIIYARYIEPTWLCVRHVRLSQAPTVRVIHVTDIHFKGDTKYLEKVVRVRDASPIFQLIGLRPMTWHHVG